MAQLSHQRDSRHHLLLGSRGCRPLALALQQDQLLLRPCPDTPEELEQVLDTAAATGKFWPC